MARRPRSCRLCGSRTADEEPVSWTGLCPPCGQTILLRWERDLSDITHEAYWNAARRTREGWRRRMDADLAATLAAFPDIAAIPDLDG